MANSRLQHYLNKIETCFTDWRIEINATKSTTLFFSKRRFLKPAPLKWFNIEINSTNFVKYLCLILKKILIWTQYINNITRQAKQASESNPLIWRHSKLDHRTKLLLYKSIIQPILLYSASVWDNWDAANRSGLFYGKCSEISSWTNIKDIPTLKKLNFTVSRECPVVY